MATCSRGGRVLPQNLCAENCTGGGSTYNISGGVNPAAWQHFSQANISSAKVSYGYTNYLSSGAAAFGSNSNTGALLHTGLLNGTQQSDGIAVMCAVQPVAYTTQTYRGSGVFPLSIPSSGSYTMGGFTFTNSAGIFGTVVSTSVVVSGVLCVITIAAEDSTGLSYRIDYKNTNSGAVTSWIYTLPQGSSQALSHSRAHPKMVWSCSDTLFAAAVLFVFGLALGWALLPEAAAVGAVYAALGGVASGAQILSGLMTVLSVPNCL